MRCWYCGQKLSQAEIDESYKYLERGFLCSTHLADIMGWIDYGDLP